MQVIPLVVILATAVSAYPHHWEIVPTKDGGIELYDLSQPLPKKDIDPSHVVFQLYTRANRDSPQTLTAGGSYTGNFVASKQTKFVTHGWMSNGNFLRDTSDAWLQTGDYNVIVVDWLDITGDWNYAEAKSAVVGVGEMLATMIDWLVSLGASTDNIQLAGHSLGAHVCGVAGNRVTAGTLSRITGMDPAAPLFGGDSTADRLDVSDARFVQVIHTNGGLLGWNDPMGTVDFYPNGGSSQPGCGIDVAGSCSHGRSIEYFDESITTGTGFKATKCDSWDNYNDGNCASNPTVLMGENIPTSASGTYYLETAKTPPYALG